MKPEVKAQWIEALRSGKYEQGIGRLKDYDGKYCCLGVLCDLSGLGTWMENSFSDPAFYITGKFSSESYTLPDEVVEWAGLDSHDPEVAGLTLSKHNDGDGTHGDEEGERGNKSFSQIADLIEEFL